MGGAIGGHSIPTSHSPPGRFNVCLEVQALILAEWLAVESFCLFTNENKRLNHTRPQNNHIHLKNPHSIPHPKWGIPRDPHSRTTTFSTTNQPQF